MHLLNSSQLKKIIHDQIILNPLFDGHFNLFILQKFNIFRNIHEYVRTYEFSGWYNLSPICPIYHITKFKNTWRDNYNPCLLAYTYGKIIRNSSNSSNIPVCPSLCPLSSANKVIVSRLWIINFYKVKAMYSWVPGPKRYVMLKGKSST